MDLVYAKKSNFALPAKTSNMRWKAWQMVKDLLPTESGMIWAYGMH